MRSLMLLYGLLLLAPLDAQLVFTPPQIDLGSLPEASEIQGDVVVSNKGTEKIYLMRADAGNGVKVYASRKTLMPGDTALLVISFVPGQKGNFSEQISIVTSDRPRPYELAFTGHIAKIKANDKTACYYFGSRKRPAGTRNSEPIAIGTSTAPRDVSNRMPGSSSPDPRDNPGRQRSPGQPQQEKIKNDKRPPVTAPATDLLATEAYKPNNILFLVDVSGSMKDSLKLPLMKNALHTLIDAVRDIDSITLVTYADTIRVLAESVSGSDKKKLHETVESLKAKGMTGGRKAIMFSQNLAQRHFITGGNNQIIMASDGKFNFGKEDFGKWKARQGEKAIVISTVAFGTDREALKTLRSIASKGDGSFIHIRNRQESRQALLDEVRLRSRRQP